MSKFSISSIMNASSNEQANKNNFKIEHINIKSIVPSEKNFYSINEIEELKESIKMFGIQQNLVVRKEKDKYLFTLISGERRYTALKELVEAGFSEFELVPCKVEYDIDDIKSELQLIWANSTTRILSDYEKSQQAVKIKELLIQLRNSGVELGGKLRDVVADCLQTSATQIARFESIENNLSDDFKEKFKEEKINVSVASELAGLPEIKQKEVFETFQEKGNLTIKEVKEVKEKLELEKPIVNEPFVNQLEIDADEEIFVTHNFVVSEKIFTAIMSKKKTFHIVNTTLKNSQNINIHDVVIFTTPNMKDLEFKGNVKYIYDDEFRAVYPYFILFCFDGHKNY